MTIGRGSGGSAARCPRAADLVGRARCVALPRRPRLHTPGDTVHMAGRCNNGEFDFTMPEDFRIVLIHPDEG